MVWTKLRMATSKPSSKFLNHLEFPTSSGVLAPSSKNSYKEVPHLQELSNFLPNPPKTPIEVPSKQLPTSKPFTQPLPPSAAQATMPLLFALRSLLGALGALAVLLDTSRHSARGGPVKTFQRNAFGKPLIP